MSYLYFRLPPNYVSTFFHTIQKMRMCFITSYGISESFYTGTNDKPFQGLIQGNGVVLLGFLLIAMLLIRALHIANLIPLSKSPISKAIYYLVG